MRTKSDITPTTPSSAKVFLHILKLVTLCYSVQAGRSFSLSRSKSIAGSAREKWRLSSSYGLLPFLAREGKENSRPEEGWRREAERLRGEVQQLKQELERAQEETRGNSGEFENVASERNMSHVTS